MLVHVCAFVFLSFIQCNFNGNFLFVCCHLGSPLRWDWLSCVCVCVLVGCVGLCCTVRLFWVHFWAWFRFPVSVLFDTQVRRQHTHTHNTTGNNSNKMEKTAKMMTTTATTNTIYLLRCTMEMRFVERKYVETHCYSGAHIYINISYSYSACVCVFVTLQSRRQNKKWKWTRKQHLQNE